MTTELTGAAWDFARGVGSTLLQTLGYYALFLLLERLAPAQRDQPLRDIGFNILYLPFYVLATALLVPPLTALVVGNLRSAIPGAFGLVPVNSWLTGGLAGLAYLLVFDFAYYWFHRAQHAFGWLWSQHKLHHSDESLNVTTSLRHHWLEEPLRVLLMTLPMALLFDLSPTFSAGVAFALSFWGFYIHANLRLHHGFLNRVFCNPEVHRLHHSRELQHRDCNFAAMFPVYDILFRTYVPPARGVAPPTGLDTGERIDSLWQANAGPFRDWARAMVPRRPPSSREL